MALPFVAWWKRRKRHDSTFTRAESGELDIVMAPPYTLPESEMEAARARVDELIERLRPNALDAGSREVLNNLINAWTDESIARLDADRDERKAVGDILIGLAEEEVARRKPRYDVDVVRALHQRQALDTSFAELAGQKTSELKDAWPQRLDHGRLEPALGPLGPANTVSPDGTDGGTGKEHEDAERSAVEVRDLPPFVIPAPLSPTTPQHTGNGEHGPGEPALL